MNEHFQIIKVLGVYNGHNSIERYKEFYCYGKHGVDEFCIDCKLRFRCMTSRDDTVEVPIAELHKQHLTDVTIKDIVKEFMPSIDYNEIHKTSKNSSIRQSFRSVWRDYKW